MGAKGEKRRIGAHEYTLTHLPAWDGFAVAQQLVGMFGEGGASLLVGAMQGQQGPGFVTAVLGDLLSGTGLIAKGLADPEFRKVCQRLLDSLMCDGRAISTEVQQQHFADNLGELVGVIAFALEINFRSFFATGPGAALLRRAQAALPGASSPLAGSSTGSPGSSAGALS